LLWSVFIVNTVAAQGVPTTPYVIHRDSIYIQSGTRSVYIEDLKKDLFASRFKPLNHFSADHQTVHYWLRINRASLPHKDLMLSVIGVDSALLFIQDVSQTLRAKRLTNYSRRWQRILNNREREFACLLSEDTSYPYLYLHITTNAMHLRYLRLTIIDPGAWYHQKTGFQFWQGFFQGVLGLMALYSLYLFFLFRSRAYLIYANYVICSSLYFAWSVGFWDDFVFLGDSTLFMTKGIILMGAIPLFYITFIRFFLKTYHHSPMIDIGLRSCLNICILLLIVAFSTSLFPAYIHVSFFLLDISTLGVAAYVIVMLCLLAWYKVPFALFMLLGSLALAGGFVINQFLYYFLNQANLMWVQIGTLSEHFIFATALGFQVKTLETEKRKAQKYFIEQLQETEHLQLQNKEQLEIKVLARTSKILRQKNEIQLKNKQLIENDKIMRETLADLQISQEKLLSKQDELEKLNQILAKREQILAKAYQEIKEKEENVVRKNEEIAIINANLERVVQERTTQLKQINYELDMFLYRSSHDLRRPLTSLMGIVQLARISDMTQSADFWIEKVNHIVKDMDKLLLKLMMVCDVGDPHLEVAKVSLPKLVRVIQNKFEDTNQKYKIEFRTEIEANLRFRTNDTLLHAIIFNLIENAVLFSRPAFEAYQSTDTPNLWHEAPYIDTLIFIQNEQLIIKIKDNGVGIAPEIYTRIFEMYFRGNEHSHGNGLGLYVVKKAVEKLSGTIEVESKLNQYTEFIIQLPPIEAIGN
jgi:signal transduction histidine kinase